MRRNCRLPESLRRAAAGAACIGVLAAGDATAQLLRIGERFQVNTFTTGIQQLPSVGAAAGGGFVVVWQSVPAPGEPGVGVGARLFDAEGNAAGEQMLVNAFTTGDQDVPDVAATSGGDFTVAWIHRGQLVGSPIPVRQSDVLVGRAFGADGNPQGANFAVSAYTSGDQRYPRVAAKDDGAFVIAWRSNGSQGDDQTSNSIQARRFGAGGAPLGATFQVNTDTSASEGSPDVAIAADGSFMAVWEVTGPSANTTDIRARLFDAGGDPAGGELLVNSYTTDVQRRPMIDAVPGGGFVVTWFSFGSPGDDEGYGGSVQARRFDAAGAPAGTDFQVNVNTYGAQQYPDVAAGAGGSFLVVWKGEISTGDVFGLGGRLFDAQGQPLGGDFAIDDDPASSPERPRVAADGRGGFVVAWHATNGGGDDTDNLAVLAQRLCIDADADQSCDDLAALVCGEASEATGALRTGSEHAGGGARAITASDALIVLRTAVGLEECPACVCDVNDSASITASDALIVLRFAVGQPVTLSCPAC
jgi:hypothetical protein